MALNLVMPISNSLAAPEQHELVILHPHSSDFASHVINAFKSWYRDEIGPSITITTDPRYSGLCWDAVETWGGIKPEADVWWGGGEYYFELARSAGLLEPHNVSEDANIPAYIGGWHLKDDSDAAIASNKPAWYVAALSGFGFMYNEEYLDANDLSIPTTWDDLVNYSYFGHISMCDPDLSGSTIASVLQMLQYKSDATTAVEWGTNVTEAWQYWLKLSGNVGIFTTSSSAVPSAVAEGHAGIGLAIDYYGYDRMKTNDKLGFSYGGATTVSPDPAGIIKGAANEGPARAFMDFLLSAEGQTLVGDYRTPANFKADTSALIPKAFDATGQTTAEFPVIDPFSPYLYSKIYGRVEQVFASYIVKNHDKAKDAWEAINELDEGTQKDEAMALYTKLPSDCNGTIAGFRDLKYDDATVQGNWESEGAANFEAALDKAGGAAGIPGFEALILLVGIGSLAYLHRKKKRK